MASSHRATGQPPFGQRCQLAPLCMRSAARRCPPKCGACGLSRALETLGEANAIGSLFAVDRRLRSHSANVDFTWSATGPCCRQHRRYQRPGCIGQICIIELVDIGANGHHTDDNHAYDFLNTLLNPLLNAVISDGNHTHHYRRK